MKRLFGAEEHGGTEEVARGLKPTPRFWWLLTALALCAAIAAGQGIASRNVKPAARAKPSGRPWNAKFTDVAAQAGLTKATIYGGMETVDYILETSGGGVALIDYDNDGLPDIFLVSGTRFGQAPAEATNRLYRNLGGLKFEDVTEKAGLRRSGWGNGVSIGDYDNDGFTDLFITYFGENALYRNNGDGTFADVTADSGLLTKADKPRYGAGSTFVDYDRDGLLDLFVSNYIDFDLQRTPKPGQNSNCNWKGMAVACGPRGLATARHYLYRNLGNGKFADVSQSAGIAGSKSSFGMTAVAADFDDDGWPDIYVACDSTPSLFFHNLGNGKFAEEGIERGIALNEDGKEQAGMGLGIGDFNLDGRLDIFKTHFADDTHVLYQNEGEGTFRDVTLAAGLAVETRYVGWGTAMADFDNDGWPDIFLVTGNVYPETEKQLPAYPYKTPPLLFRNLGNNRFEQIFAAQGGPALDAAHSSRGAAFGDLDNDGDLDIVVWNRNEAPSLLRNNLAGEANWLQIQLTGAKANRSALGARVTVSYSGKSQAQEVLSQSSFYSSNGLRLHFGLGSANSADVEIRWPGGERSVRRAVGANQLVRIAE